jgi:predicted nucleic acid-binding protein
MILVDTGPLVAMIHEDDDLHERCKNEFFSFREPLGTVWPVVTEALYLLNFAWQAQAALLDMIDLGAVEILPLVKHDVSRIKALMWKYRDLRMDLADAALVCVAEREKLRRVFTLDRRDFEIYRPARLGRFSIFPTR